MDTTSEDEAKAAWLTKLDDASAKGLAAGAAATTAGHTAPAIAAPVTDAPVATSAEPSSDEDPFKVLFDSFEPYKLPVVSAEMAAETGYPSAADFGCDQGIACMRRAGVTSERVPPEAASDFLRPGLDMEYPGLRVVHLDPLVCVIDDFLTPAECQAHIALSESESTLHFAQSGTFGGETKARTSTTWFARYQDCPYLVSKASALLGAPVSRFEEPQIVRYQPGQQFSWHFDAVQPQFLEPGRDQRLATLLVYCNSVPAGGRTVFRDLLIGNVDGDGTPTRLEIEPVKGRALVFFPSANDGEPDFRLVHAGEPAEQDKWLAQFWLHHGRYDAQAPAGTSQLEGAQLACSFGEAQGIDTRWL